MKAAPGSVTLADRCAELFAARPDGRQLANLLQPQGTKIHAVIYFTFMFSCLTKIKSKWSQGLLLLFLFPSSFLLRLFSSLSLAVLLWSVNQILLMYESKAETVHQRPLYSAGACRVQPDASVSFSAIVWVSNAGYNSACTCPLVSRLYV